MGSTEAVAYIKRLFKAQKVGHAGTLDPLASGMLPIALGDATKTVSYVMDGRKTYLFTATWGEERTTDDLEGEPSNTSDNRPTKEEIEALLPNYIGTILQQPPIYSAIKVNGMRAYDLVRDGSIPQLEPREVNIFSFKILSHDYNSTTFCVECGKGTYIRSLARDLGRALNCYGHITFLRRLSVMPFSESQMITIEQLTAAAPKDETETFAALDALLTKPAAALSALPQMDITNQDLSAIKHGRSILVRNQSQDCDPFCLKYDGEIVSIGFIKQGAFYPKKVFV